MARTDHMLPLPLKPTTIALIKERARTTPAPLIAREIGWSADRLERVCRAHGIEITPQVETTQT